MKAILLVSHGSRSDLTRIEVESLVAALKRHTNFLIFEYAFLEVSLPDIPAGLRTCVAKGATDVIVLLNFLNSGRHVNGDIPLIVEEARQKHPAVNFRISQPVGQHPDIVNIFIDLIEHA